MKKITLSICLILALLCRHGLAAPNPDQTPAPEHVRILIENACKKPIEVAIYYEGLDGKWTTRGWYEIQAGASSYLVDTRQSKFYTYARTKDQMIIWKGDDAFQKVDKRDFGFALKQISPPLSGTWKETFNCPDAGNADAEEASKADALFISGDAIGAAKKGHALALRRTLDSLLFRANSLRLADPQKALELYMEAKKANPALSLGSDEEDEAKAMQMCAEPSRFDAEKFIQQYDIDDSSKQWYDYPVWEIAEEASREGRFGKPDPELLLNLVCRGGLVTMEMVNAVKDVYSNWRAGLVKEFKICNYTLSGYGQIYCSQRKNEAEEEARALELQVLQDKLGSDAAPLLKTAFEVAEKFFNEKARIEEGPGGTGGEAQVLQSLMTQKKQFVKLIIDIQAGVFPDPKVSIAKSDRELNALYKRILKAAGDQQLFMQGYLQVKPDDLRAIQRLWISYRDATVALVERIRPNADKDILKCWLTEQRVKDFQELLKGSEL